MLAELTSLAYRLDPSLILDDLGCGVPDPWQRRVLRSTSHYMLLNAHRQAGKSTAVSGLALGTALHDPGSLTLLISASLRQSGEIFRKVVDGYKVLGSPVPAVEGSSITLALANGSRIVSLPDSPDTIVGFSGPKVIIVDEASRTSDETFLSIMPMLAISRGRLVAMSTPRGKRGWWSQQWHDGGDAWERVLFKATDNPRIDPDWLEEQRVILGERWFRQDFMCSFEDTIGQCFTTESIDHAFATDAAPLFAAPVQ